MKRILLLAFSCVVAGCVDAGDDPLYLEAHAGDYVVLTRENSGSGFGYLRKSDMKILVQVLDRNRDGVPDEIIYSSLGQDSSKEVTVVDYDFDGQADERRHADSKVEIWYENSWHEIINEDQAQSIEIEGKRRPVSQVRYGHLKVEQ